MGGKALCAPYMSRVGRKFDAGRGILGLAIYKLIAITWVSDHRVGLTSLFVPQALPFRPCRVHHSPLANL